MLQFTFQALAQSGEQIYGTLDAPSRREAFREIESRQLAPISVLEKVGSANGSHTTHMTHGTHETHETDSARG